VTVAPISATICDIQSQVMVDEHSSLTFRSAADLAELNTAPFAYQGRSTWRS